MSDEPRRITQISVHEEKSQIIQGTGRILRERTFWCVEYTVSEQGWLDRRYCPTFTNEAAAWAHVWKLAERVSIPDEVLDAA